MTSNSKGSRKIPLQKLEAIISKEQGICMYRSLRHFLECPKCGHTETVVIKVLMQVNEYSRRHCSPIPYSKPFTDDFRQTVCKNCGYNEGNVPKDLFNKAICKGCTSQ
jgi:Zn ribbon nucleic-acid-binding protein